MAYIWCDVHFVPIGYLYRLRVQWYILYESAEVASALVKMRICSEKGDVGGGGGVGLWD